MTLKKQLQVIVLLLTVVTAFADIETIYTYDPGKTYPIFLFSATKHTGYMWVSLILVYLFCIFLIGNVFSASFIFLFFSYALGIVERYYCLSRGSLLTAGELKNFRVALKVEHSCNTILFLIHMP